MKKILVKLSNEYAIEISEELDRIANSSFIFRYNRFTRVSSLLKQVDVHCGLDEDALSASKRFPLLIDSRCLEMDPNHNLFKLLRHFEINDEINLYYQIPIPGGRGIDEINGIRFFMHSKELRHVPHVHAKYQGQDISIELETLKCKGRFKNAAKMHQAIEYVKNNKVKLMQLYSDYTNGIKVDDVDAE